MALCLTHPAARTPLSATERLNWQNLKRMCAYCESRIVSWFSATETKWNCVTTTTTIIIFIPPFKHRKLNHQQIQMAQYIIDANNTTNQIHAHDLKSANKRTRNTYGKTNNISNCVCLCIRCSLSKRRKKRHTHTRIIKSIRIKFNGFQHAILFCSFWLVLVYSMFSILLKEIEKSSEKGDISSFQYLHVALPTIRIQLWIHEAIVVSSSRKIRRFPKNVTSKKAFPLSRKTAIGNENKRSQTTWNISNEKSS